MPIDIYMAFDGIYAIYVIHDIHHIFDTELDLSFPPLCTLDTHPEMSYLERDLHSLVLLDFIKLAACGHDFCCKTTISGMREI